MRMKDLILYEQLPTASASMTEAEKARVEQVRTRFYFMANAKSNLEAKWRSIKQLYEIYEAKITQGEQWNEPFRFAELFGSCQRKYSDLIKNLPEVKIRATKNSSQNFAIAQQATIEHTERTTNSTREKSRAIWDSILYGTGILFEGFTKLERKITDIDPKTGELTGKERLACLYAGLVSERIDPRDFFIDETATVFFDETGITGARDCIRRRIYPYSTFRERFKDYKHVEEIVPVVWGSDVMGWSKVPYEKESQENKTIQQYVTVLEYWNVEADAICLIANGIEIYFGANPFMHKRLPFTVYYNYRRDDSLWGVSEAEILAPFIYAEEEIINLMILDAKLALQPALAVSGDVMFNPEDNELQPGAIFTLRGLNGGKVGDAIAPLRFGGIPTETFNVLEKLDDLRIIITGDDIRSLYSNPDQLATQTLSKREVSQKRLASNIYQNTVDSERGRIQQRLSNIIQFYAKPYQTIDGRVDLRRIMVEGYDVMQQDDENAPEFKQRYGAQSYFTLNDKSLGSSREVEIEIIDSKMEDELRKEELENLSNYLKTVVELMPIAPQMLDGMDVRALLKQMATKLDLNINELFPTPSDDIGFDSVDMAIELCLMGIVPDPDQNVDPLKVTDRLIKFMSTETYKNAGADAKKAIKEFLSLTNQYVETYYKQKLDEKRGRARVKTFSPTQQGNMGGPGKVPGQGGGAGVPEVSGVPVSNGGESGINTAPVNAPTGVAKRLGFQPGATSGN
ncbi:MAG: hypothetical protein A4E53_01716 [Pelotomaculum sp. PtaB.Bin104]|nr:MAG: hypothetical protein A4E53_01716 [Pelotomaculum sp. PtaB.Bin104]